MAESFLSHFFKKKPRVIDPWDSSEAFYVGKFFKQHLNIIASALSLKGQPVQPRFNFEQKCVELHNGSGYVIAQVRAHGEMGTPYEIIVTSFSLDEADKMLFALILPIRIEFEIAQKAAA